MLRRVLARRVRKRIGGSDEPPETHDALIAETVARAQRAGLVDDARFAESRLATLRRRGVSAHAARAALASRGIERELLDGMLAKERDEAEGDETPEEAAARAYARRRRLGPHRPRELREANRDRDLAAMGRAGFPLMLARSVIDGASDENDAD